MTIRQPAIGRGAVVTACGILEKIRTNADLESLLLEYGLSDDVPSAGSIAKTVFAIKAYAVNNPGRVVQTDFGEKSFAALIIEKAIEIDGVNADAAHWQKLERYLNLDGFALLRGDIGPWLKTRITGFTVALPGFIELPESVSDIERLLRAYSFTVPARHLASARENVAQADWEAANAQCRTFMEAVTDAIADRLYPADSATRDGGLRKRQLLAEKGFLSREKHEFGDGNGQTFLPGLAKLLHPDGAHPGLSTRDDAMFRLQLVVVTAHWLLKRLESELNR